MKSYAYAGLPAAALVAGTLLMAAAPSAPGGQADSAPVFLAEVPQVLAYESQILDLPRDITGPLSVAVSLDGAVLRGDAVVPLVDDGGEHQVEVVLG